MYLYFSGLNPFSCANVHSSTVGSAAWQDVPSSVSPRQSFSLQQGNLFYLELYVKCYFKNKLTSTQFFY